MAVAQQWPPPATQPQRGPRIADSSPPSGHPKPNVTQPKPTYIPPSPSTPTPRSGVHQSSPAAQPAQVSGTQITQAPQRTSFGYTPESRESHGYDPSTRTVKAPTETVQGQLPGILEADNVLLQRARTRGKQYANERGILNSSLGAQAAEGAMLDVALPIAQFDAGIYDAASQG